MPKIDLHSVQRIGKQWEQKKYRSCFVIMSYSSNPRLADTYELAIKPAIENLKFACVRVDELEFNGRVTDEISKGIESAAFVVFDATEARPNCYYELGVAHALGKQVIHITSSVEDIHFDVKDFNFIVYSRIEELKTKLTKRIAAIYSAADS